MTISHPLSDQGRVKTRRDIPTVPEPLQEVGALFRTCYALKQTTDMLTGQTREIGERAMTWNDLLRLGLVTQPDLPQD